MIYWTFANVEVKGSWFPIIFWLFRKVVSLQKKSCTRQIESKLSLRSFAFSLQIGTNNLLYETRNWTKRIRHGKLPRLSIFVETNQASCFFCPTESHVRRQHDQVVSYKKDKWQYLLYSRISNFTIANLYIKGGFYSETAFLYALHSFPHFPQKVSSRLCYWVE